MHPQPEPPNVRDTLLDAPAGDAPVAVGHDVRYLTDSKGEKTDVLVPLTTWTTLLAAYDRLISDLEDQEDRKFVEEWLTRRASGEVSTVSLDEFERELIADGLLPG